MAQNTHQPAHLIEVRNLYKYYSAQAGDVPALKGISLDIDRGEFLAIVGKSGSGKSTLVNMIAAIESPTSGQVTYKGLPVHALSEDEKDRWRGRNLGIVFQFFQLLPSLNLLENITLAMDFVNTYLPKERKERALHLLEQVGIAEHAYKIPTKISGGQQQRVAIARALANDPAVIIADEPTGNLDSQTAGEIIDLFLEVRDLGKTLIVVTHDKDVAARASHTIEICDGVLLA